MSGGGKQLFEFCETGVCIDCYQVVHAAPTTFFIVIMSTIGGLQGGFDQVTAMTAGKYETEVLTYYLYKLAFTDEFQLGLASAVAWVMFAAIFAMTLVNYRYGSRIVND